MTDLLNTSSAYHKGFTNFVAIAYLFIYFQNSVIFS